jgi:hypothetical protein
VASYHLLPHRLHALQNVSPTSAPIRLRSTSQSQNPPTRPENASTECDANRRPVLEDADLDELIARQVHVFAERGERFEWKLHGHDRPRDLPQRLRAAGFVPEDREAIVIARVADIAGEPRLPEGVSLREATSRTDFERIAALEQAVWGDEDQQSWLVDMLESASTREGRTSTLTLT